MDTSPVILWQMPRLWGLPNASPFCMKVETWLRMAQIPFEVRQLAGPPKSRSGKVPYVERSDGSLLADSSVIVETLGKERGVDLDEHLSADQRAMAVLVQRTLEEDLYFIVLYDRWVDEGGWAITRPGYFGEFPWLVRNLIVPIVRCKVMGAARGQGVSRLGEDYRLRKGIADINAIAQLFGDKTFFFGQQPSTIDAVLYAFLANCLQTPYRSSVIEAAQQHPNLVDYCSRMKARYYADFE